jgi:transcriptional regulator with XRE-family HTH domain
MEKQAKELLGDRIRAMRKRYGMPAAVLADRVGISRQQLYFIEGNKTLDPGALTVMRIAEQLGVSTDYLLKGKRKIKRLTDDVEHSPPYQERPRKRLAGVSAAHVG